MKSRRHKVIREIVENKNIETQIQLTEELIKHGFQVTQATISRDIKELGLIKVAAGDNLFKYSFPSHVLAGNAHERAKRMLKENVLKYNSSGNMVVIRTLPGIAQGMASCIDNLGWSELVGSVAGDDTIFLLVKEGVSCGQVIERLQALGQ